MQWITNIVTNTHKEGDKWMISKLIIKMLKTIAKEELGSFLYCMWKKYIFIYK
jgi:hypothetical protein